MSLYPLALRKGGRNLKLDLEISNSNFFATVIEIQMTVGDT